MKDSLNGGVLKKKKTRGQESDTKHKKSHFFCVKSVDVVFSFLSFHFHFFIMDFYVIVSKDCAQLVFGRKVLWE